MARLASQAAGGFFPSPPRVVEALRRQLTPAPTGAKWVARVLDPCAGTGEPAAAIAEALGGRSLRRRQSRCLLMALLLVGPTRRERAGIVQVSCNGLHDSQPASWRKR